MDYTYSGFKKSPAVKKFANPKATADVNFVLLQDSGYFVCVAVRQVRLINGKIPPPELSWLVSEKSRYVKETGCNPVLKYWRNGQCFFVEEKR